MDTVIPAEAEGSDNCVSAIADSFFMTLDNMKLPNHEHTLSRWASFPFSPVRWPFFYGWMIVAMAKPTR